MNRQRICAVAIIICLIAIVGALWLSKTIVPGQDSVNDIPRYIAMGVAAVAGAIAYVTSPS